MRIFISIPWFLPAYRAGGPIQSVANLVENFTKGIEYFIFCGNTDLNGEKLPVKTGEWLPFNDHTKVMYAENDISRCMTSQTDILKPDVLFIIGIYSWHFTLVPLLFCKAGKKIISVRGMLHAGALSQKKIKKRLFLSALKLTGIPHKTMFHATDENEAQFIRKEFGDDTRVAVAENFGRKVMLFPAQKKEAGKLKLVTIALISPMKNYLEVLSALLLIKEDVEYHIYGPIKDAGYWRQCESVIAVMPSNISVRYHGEINPAEVDAALAGSHVFIMPSKSENFGHAIFEALSAGKPVITGNATPWNGLAAAQAGVNTDNSITALTEVIALFAVMDNAAYESYVAGATAYIHAQADKEKTSAQYTRMFSA